MPIKTSPSVQKKSQNRLDYLLSQISENALRLGLEREISKLRMNRKFGLVYEEHMPEHVRLYHHPVAVGAKVVFRNGKGEDVFNVMNVEKKAVQLFHEIDGHWEEGGIEDLVVIKKFEEPIYPSLIPVDRIVKGGSKPYHSIINADNFHALQLLLYTYEGKVDVIYIDPPYNTGSRDWKYNNNYVDSNDQYRHSKWLSMMKKRLLLAKKLLKPKGVLCITIDDYEMHHLKCMLEDLSAEILGTIIIKNNPSGRSTVTGVSISHEYALLVAFSQNAKVGRLDRTEKQIARYNFSDEISPFEWVNFRKHGGVDALRVACPTMFYPIFVQGEKIRVPSMEWDTDLREWKLLEDPKAGELTVLPVAPDGEERRWKWAKETVKANIEEFCVKKDRNKEVGIYMKSRLNQEGLLPLTVWDKSEYSATEHGTNLLKKIFGETGIFSFPKSLYAVSDCLRACNANKDAIILDFFAGSGTTLHATCLLNSEDNGNRRCILVTNNEVEEKIIKKLADKGIQEGNSHFERYGICESVTWPRCKYVVQGKRDDGTKLPGEYLSGRPIKEGFEENIQYFRLDYLDPNAVAYREKLEDILPILWLMAGAKGEIGRVKNKDWFISKDSAFAVLMKESLFCEFKAEITNHKDLTHVFIVTDSEEAYRDMCMELPSKFKTKMLYKSYLENFRINIAQT